MTRGWKIFWTLVGLGAVGLFFWELLNGWLEIVTPYSDGHGPDPGSSEALMGAERRRQDAPRYAAMTVFQWLVVSAIIAGVTKMIRTAIRRVSVRNRDVC